MPDQPEGVPEMRWNRGAGILAALMIAAGTAQAEGTLHLYNWAGYTSPELLTRFEEAHDVEVTLTTFASPAEARAKLDAKDHGIDIVIASAPDIRALIRLGRLTQARPDRMENFSNVSERWRDPAWDRGRRYSAPWQWGGLGIIADSGAYGGAIDTSAILFDPPDVLAGKITVVPARDEIIGMALLYLGARPCTRDSAALDGLREVLTASSAKWQAVQYGPADAPVAAYWSHGVSRARAARPSISFAYPKEGFPLWMDSAAVPRDAPNIENAKLFLNFIMDPRSAALISSHSGYGSGIDGSEAFLPATMQDAEEITASAEILEAGVFLPACPETVRESYASIWRELTGN
jgi:spermidine/putrescine transport system substrate-binding protein